MIFNTIHLSAWVLDYLSDRPQYLRARKCQSDAVVCSTGAPQGTVLAPFLFTCHLQKFSDNSAIVGLITDGDDREHREQDFKPSPAQLRVTKELVVNIQGTDIEIRIINR